MGTETSALRHGRETGEEAGLAWKAMRSERGGDQDLSLPPWQMNWAGARARLESGALSKGGGDQDLRLPPWRVNQTGVWAGLLNRALSKGGVDQDHRSPPCRSSPRGKTSRCQREETGSTPVIGTVRLRPLVRARRSSLRLIGRGTEPLRGCGQAPFARYKGDAAWLRPLTVGGRTLNPVMGVRFPSESPRRCSIVTARPRGSCGGAPAL